MVAQGSTAESFRGYDAEEIPNISVQTRGQTNRAAYEKSRDQEELGGATIESWGRVSSGCRPSTGQIHGTQGPTDYVMLRPWRR